MKNFLKSISIFIALPILSTSHFSKHPRVLGSAPITRGTQPLSITGFKTKFEHKIDTIDPEQRLPDGAVRPVPKRILPNTFNESFKARIEPASWWVGFKNPDVELMIHDRDISGHQVNIKHKGLIIKKIHRPENRNYLFVTMTVTPAAAIGNVKINLVKGTDKRTFDWHLNKRNTEGGRNQGLTTSDFVYLIMPDRFANGDASNDYYDDMLQKGIDRRKMYFRHGGDLKGIMDKLPYLKDLGVTALWLNPVQENDQVLESYHGYAITDLYNIDRRFGKNEDYKQLVLKCHQNGIKMVMDVAPNHMGNNAYHIKDIPESNWIHQYDSFTRTTYRDQVVFDPYASKADKDAMVNGWFDVTMPDMNPEGNEHLYNHITQSYIWWLEYAGVDAFRIDTYLYNNPDFMAKWVKRIRNEYPNVMLFGETWVNGIINQAYMTEKNVMKKSNSSMQGVTDFQLYFAIQEALTREQGWSEGIMRLYQNMANDKLYYNAYQNVTFFDNHDLSRFYSTLGEDIDKYKSAIAWLLTCRGIPQWYYGAELGFTGYTNPDGKVRQDMPGGWAEDSRSVFTEGGRSEKENTIYNYVKKLANWRKSKSCLHNGKMTQYVPVDGVYVYFRYDEKSTVMVVMNTHSKPTIIDTKRFRENIKSFTKGKNIANDELINDMSKISLGRFETKVIELSN